MTGSGRPLPLFPNYTQIPRRVPVAAWGAIRVLSVTAFLALVVGLLVAPEEGLTVLWGLVVPVLPALWLLAPGLWRNACPLAAANQTPRLLGVTRALPQPAWLRRHAHLIGISLFVALVVSRKFVFNQSGPATAGLLLAVIFLAFSGGLLLKGKSGWCSSVCPLLPVQRLYGQAPAVVVPNSHCQPCVGCTKNCYDFNPGVAQIADLDDVDERYVGYRRFFAGIFPGLVYAFFTTPNVPEIASGELLVRVGLALLLSLGSYQAVVSLIPASRVQVTALYGAIAFGIFYWHAPRAIESSLDALFDVALGEPFVWTARALAALAVLQFLARAVIRERQFAHHVGAGPGLRISSPTALQGPGASASDELVVTIEGDHRLVAAPDESLLDLIEKLGLPIEPGCRMGVCGADPVAVIAGDEALSPIEDDEAGTLERLGYGANTRMACAARVCTGPVEVSLTPTPADADAPAPTDGFDRTVERVVILGNGIAGVTAADFVRRRHPDCKIDIVGREPHHLYNRMAISRLIYGRSALHGLFLQPEDWYETHRIDCWLNTEAVGVDVAQRTVSLGTGETLGWDRLVLAMGSSSFVPPIPGTDKQGVFVVREAADAAAIRRFRQTKPDVRRAVVVGGGLLGLETAYALMKLGLRTTVLERGPWLLQRQVDEGAARLLAEHLHGLGIEVLLGTVTEEIEGNGAVQAVALADGRRVPTELVVIAAGVRPNVALASAAGIAVNVGVLVDDNLATSAPGVYAAGDVAEHRGRVYGLWPAAVDQAKVAARTLASDHPDTEPAYDGTVVSTMLKVAGVDLASFGRLEKGDDDEEFILDDTGDRRHVRVLANNGRLVGAVVYGAPDAAGALGRLVKVSAPLEEARVWLAGGPGGAVHRAGSSR